MPVRPTTGQGGIAEALGAPPCERLERTGVTKALLCAEYCRQSKLRGYNTVRAGLGGAGSITAVAAATHNNNNNINNNNNTRYVLARAPRKPSDRSAAPPRPSQGPTRGPFASKQAMPTKASQQCRLTGLFLSYWVVTGASFMFLLNEKKKKKVWARVLPHTHLRATCSLPFHMLPRQSYPNKMGTPIKTVRILAGN